MLVVLVDAHLLRAVAAVEFRHDLLVGGLAAPSFKPQSFDFTCGMVSALVGARTQTSIPLLCSFSALLVAWRDLKPFLCCLVVLRWWWLSATEGAILLLPPALNLKGIDDATLNAMRQKCCASALQVRDKIVDPLYNFSGPLTLSITAVQGRQRLAGGWVLAISCIQQRYTILCSIQDQMYLKTIRHLQVNIMGSPITHGA